MRQVYDSVPLVGLDAVVLDTETTGLDPKRARVVEIGAVAIEKGRRKETLVFEALVAPGLPMPPAAARIHGITDAELAAAPPFWVVAPRLKSFLGDRVLIGHNTGFDLAILAREHELAGIDWQPPRWLDVALLARAAAPRLAAYTVDALAEWLDIEVSGRHRALSDASTTAAIFLKLVPQLRAVGVRTLSEAEATCRRFEEARATASSAGWTAMPEAGQRLQALSRIDSYPYRHRVADVMAAPVVRIASEAGTDEALGLLLERKISSVIVDGRDGRTGLVTERDLLRAIMREKTTGARETLGDYMSSPLEMVQADDFIYRAIARMDRLGLRHLPVVDDAGAIVGLVTPRNLLRQRASAALALKDTLDEATGVPELARNWSRLPEVAQALRDEEVDPRAIASIISAELCAMTARAAQLAEAKMMADGHSKPPVPYAVLVLGSGGRGESLLAADQDNAIVYAQGEPDGPEDRYFAALAAHMAETLDVIGIPYCKGGVMAKNTAWRHSSNGWRAIIESWIRRSSPQDLLNIDIFFDGVGVYGDQALARDVLDHAQAAARSSKPFLLLLTELARDWSAPFAFLGGLKTDEDGRVDLKKGGLMPIFTAARVMALRHGIAGRSTGERITSARDAGAGSPEDLDAAIAAHKSLLGVILDQQLLDIAAGTAPGNRVLASRLAKSALRDVKAALRAIPGLLGVLSEGRV